MTGTSGQRDAGNGQLSASDVASTLARVADTVLGLTEVAKTLGVSVRTLQRYLANEDLEFPEPVVVLARGRLWARRDVERWAKRTLPLQTGRPPKTD